MLGDEAYEFEIRNIQDVAQGSCLVALQIRIRGNLVALPQLVRGRFRLRIRFCE